MMRLTKHSTNVYRTLKTNKKREGESLEQRLKMLQARYCIVCGLSFLISVVAVGFLKWRMILNIGK